MDRVELYVGELLLSRGTSCGQLSHAQVLRHWKDKWVPWASAGGISARYIARAGAQIISPSTQDDDLA